MTNDIQNGGPVPLDSVSKRIEPSMTGTHGVKVLVILEGINDVAFFKRATAILHADDPALPDLNELEAAGSLIFVPLGGSDLALWSRRFAPLGIAEFHLYDRDLPPLTASRQVVVDAVNGRPRCRAALTSKRQLENYLHADAIFEARGLQLTFSDEDDVAGLVAQRCYAMIGGSQAWDDIPPRRRRKLRHRAKKWLNTEAVEKMTVGRFAASDPQGEVKSWLAAIGALAGLRP